MGTKGYYLAMNGIFSMFWLVFGLAMALAFPSARSTIAGVYGFVQGIVIVDTIDKVRKAPK